MSTPDESIGRDRPEAGPQGGGGDSLRVLVLDDETDIAEEIADFLGTAGVPCLAETDPRRAIDLVGRMPEIAVVVTDLRMPQIDGITLLSTVQDGRDARDAVEFVFLTAHGLVDNLGASASVPPFAVLRKPIALAALREVVLGAIGKARARRKAAP